VKISRICRPSEIEFAIFNGIWQSHWLALMMLTNFSELMLTARENEIKSANRHVIETTNKKIANV
jgi:hypothetical protein